MRRWKAAGTVLGILVGIALSPAAFPAPAASGRLPIVNPREAGISAERLRQIDTVVAEGIAAGEMPGCVVLVGRAGKVAFLKAFGHRQVEPGLVPMTTDTLFDLASLTKPIATATSVMVLVGEGRLRLEDRVAEHLPEFGNRGKETITVFQLLTHQSGLLPDNTLADYRDGPQKAWERIFALTLREPPGSKFLYSDVGYLVLGELVRRISGQNVDAFSRERVFSPLRMTETGFLPNESLGRRAAPTEMRDNAWMQGEVHDPRAHLLGGIAGHAGLFSTAEDLAIFADMMLHRGRRRSVRILSEEAFTLMTTPYPVSSGRRGLGWDMRTGYSSNRGRAFSNRAFGHGGFTGTAIWVDPGLDLFVIFLSNRLHPDGKGSVNPLAGRIGTLAAEAIEDRAGAATASGQVLTGIDVLQRDGFRQLAGRRIGLITNQTGVNREGMSTARVLHEAKNLELVALLSPEHGLHGKLDTRHIGDTRDPQTGLPVYSLYGKTRRPTAEMLEGLDTLVFDIQDIGTRFYTYISTMGYAMQAAAEHKVRFVVLDRPNPIGGVGVDGPVLDAGRESFVGFHRLPVRHGMTVGELAGMFSEELGLELDLAVIRVERWRRGDYFDTTGLPWVNPSPNMRSLAEAVLYPGIGLLEKTNLSVGRGTVAPFEIVGAPWIDAAQLAGVLNEADLPGVRFAAVSFMPNASKYANQLCQGVTITVTDRDRFRPLRVGLEMARQLRIGYPATWEADAYGQLLGNRAVLAAVLAAERVSRIEAIYRPGLEAFRVRRGQFLLYPE